VEIKLIGLHCHHLLSNCGVMNKIIQASEAKMAQLFMYQNNIEQRTKQEKNKKN